MQQVFVALESPPLSLAPVYHLLPSPHEGSRQTKIVPSPATQEERRTMQARIRRLGRRSLLTPTALAQLGESQLPTETLHALLTMLEGPFEERWEERSVAVWALGLADLTARQRETVSATLCGILRRRPFVNRVHANQPVDPICVWFAVCMSLWLGLNSLFHPTSTKITIGPLGLLFCGGIIGLCSGHVLKLSQKMGRTLREGQLRSAVVTALGRIGSVSSLPTLARITLTYTVQDPNASRRSAAEAALCACLDNLTPQHAGQVEADVVPNLCRLLDSTRTLMNYSPDRAETFALRILSALEKIGDGQAASTVRKMINTGWTAPVNHAAKQLLPLLQARRQQETDQRGLLRGATMPPIVPGTLLRPTGLSDDDSTPDRLLRPSHQP